MTAREAVAVAAWSTLLTEHAAAAQCLGEVLAAGGRRVQAAAALEEAARLCARKEVVPGVTRVRALLAAL